MEEWRRRKEDSLPHFYWLRSLRPPTFPLTNVQPLTIPIGDRCARIRNLCFAKRDTLVVAWFKHANEPVANSARVMWDSANGREIRSIEVDHFPFADPCDNGQLCVAYGDLESGGWGARYDYVTRAPASSLRPSPQMKTFISRLPLFPPMGAESSPVDTGLTVTAK